MDKLPPKRPSQTSRLDVGATVLPAGHSLRLHNAAQSKPSEGVVQTLKTSASDLRSRLASFIPALAAANVDTQARIASEGQAALDPLAVEEGERHVEMSVAITQLPDGAQDDAAEALEDATAEAAGAGGRGRASRSRKEEEGVSRALGLGGGHRTGKRPRIESINEGGGGAGAGGAPSGDSSDSSEEGTGGGSAPAGLQTTEGLPAGKWITDPQVLAQHRHAILQALIAQQEAKLAAEEDGEVDSEDEAEGDEADDGGAAEAE